MPPANETVLLIWSVGRAFDALRRLSAYESDLTIARVPSLFEIPLAAKKLASGGRYDAIICVGAVIRGETPHFDSIAAELTNGMTAASINKDVPIANGIIATDTVEQAINCVDVKTGDNGVETAIGAVETTNLLKEL